MRRTDFQKYIYAGLFLFAVFFLMLLFLFITRVKEEERKEDEIVPTKFQLVPTRVLPTPTDVVPTFTGAKEGDFISQEEKTKINKAFDLRQMLPFTSDSFDIIYDYQQAKFKVGLKRPYDENMQKFNQWLINSSFDLIPEKEFVYEEL